MSQVSSSPGSALLGQLYPAACSCKASPQGLQPVCDPQTTLPDSPSCKPFLLSSSSEAQAPLVWTRPETSLRPSGLHSSPPTLTPGHAPIAVLPRTLSRTDSLSPSFHLHRYPPPPSPQPHYAPRPGYAPKIWPNILFGQAPHPGPRLLSLPRPTPLARLGPPLPWPQHALLVRPRPENITTPLPRLVALLQLHAPSHCHVPPLSPITRPLSVTALLFFRPRPPGCCTPDPPS